jgi:hypothetical protein
VKLSNHAKASLELKLLVRSIFSESLFLSAYSLPVHRSFDDEVNNIGSTAYAVVRCNVDVRVQVKALDKLSVVVSRVIAHKAVELSGYFILIEHSAYDSPLSSPSMISVEVAEGDINISLFVVSICRRVSCFDVCQGLH